MNRLHTRNTALVLIAIVIPLLGIIFALGLVAGINSIASSRPETANPFRFPTDLNITREQYDAALARWNSLHVTDYEAIVQSGDMEKWKIVVHVDPPDP